MARDNAGLAEDVYLYLRFLHFVVLVHIHGDADCNRSAPEQDHEYELDPWHLAEAKLLFRVFANVDVLNLRVLLFLEQLNLLFRRRSLAGLLTLIVQT